MRKPVQCRGNRHVGNFSTFEHVNDDVTERNVTIYEIVDGDSDAKLRTKLPLGCWQH